MLQNLRSSTEPAHANAEASVSGHRLDSDGKSIQKVNKEEGIFLSQKKMGLRIFLRDWNEFAAKTEFGIVLEYFFEVGMKLRLRQNLGLS